MSAPTKLITRKAPHNMASRLMFTFPKEELLKMEFLANRGKSKDVALYGLKVIWDDSLKRAHFVYLINCNARKVDNWGGINGGSSRADVAAPLLCMASRTRHSRTVEMNATLCAGYSFSSGKSNGHLSTEE